MIYALPILPHAGLGNMLLPWARAVAFCHRTGAKMIGPCWLQIPHIGPWLRSERYKRFYVADFRRFGLFKYLFLLVKTVFLKHIDESEWHENTDNVVVRFTGFGRNKGFFENISDSHEFVVKELNKLCLPSITNNVMELIRGGPYIGVHVRRGDFSKLGIAASDDWYIRAIAKALEIDQGHHSMVRIFSDARSDELQFIRAAFPNENLVIMPKAPAIQDILALSKSTVLVASPESTFSMWAVYCGQMPSIWCAGCSEHGVYVEKSRAIFL